MEISPTNVETTECEGNNICCLIGKNDKEATGMTVWITPCCEDIILRVNASLKSCLGIY